METTTGSNSLQGIVSINMIHVARWNCTMSFKQAGKLLKKGQFLLFYGPFKLEIFIQVKVIIFLIIQ